MLPGLFADYVILDEWSASTEERLRRVPGPFVASMIDSWLSSPFTAGTLYQLYEAVGGHRRSGLNVLEQTRHDELLKQCLREALCHGRLVALEVPRARIIVRTPTEPRRPTKTERTEATFVAIHLVDTEDNPVPNAKYHITLPDGSTREGTLNQEGYARVDNVSPGTCQVTFPELDGAAWTLGS